jgi:Flp pilus assembly protein TadD
MIKIVIYLFLGAACLYGVSLSQTQKSASVWFQDGKEKASNKDYYGAVEDFTMAIEIKPDYAKAYYHRGIAYLKYNRKSKTRSNVFLQKSRADFMKAKELGLVVEQKYLDECEETR